MTTILHPTRWGDRLNVSPPSFKRCSLQYQQRKRLQLRRKLLTMQKSKLTRRLTQSISSPTSQSLRRRCYHITTDEAACVLLCSRRIIPPCFQAECPKRMHIQIRVGHGLNPSMNWIGWDDCGPRFNLVIIAAQLMLFLSNYDL